MKTIIVPKDSDFLDRVQRRGSPPKSLYVTSGNSSTRHLREVFLKTFPEAQRLLLVGEEIVEINGSSLLPPFQHDLADHTQSFKLPVCLPQILGVDGRHSLRKRAAQLATVYQLRHRIQ